MTNYNYDDTTITTSTEDFEQPDTGLVRAVCVFVNNIGTQKKEFEGRVKFNKQVVISFELETKMKSGTYAGMPFMLSKFYTMSMLENASLRQHLEAWRGKGYTEEQLAKFDLKNIIGKSCMLNVMETKTGKRKIASIVSLPVGMEPLKPTQTEPSPKFLEWINRLRSESVEAKKETQAEPHRVDNSSDDLPF